MMSADLLISIALTALLVLLLRLAEGRDVWPEPSETRFQLGWPRGVQEEEPCASGPTPGTPRPGRVDAPHDGHRQARSERRAGVQRAVGPQSLTRPALNRNGRPSRTGRSCARIEDQRR